MKTKEFNIAVIFVLLSLFAFRFFPVEGIFQQVVTMLIFFVVIPLLFNRFVLKNSVEVLKFSVGDFKNGILWSAYSLLSLIVIFLTINYFFDFVDKYSVPVYITKSFPNFLLYEFLIVAPLVILYEFYFRGFLMPILQSKAGYWSVLIQALVFLALLFGSGEKNIIQLIPYLIFAVFGGVIAYKSRSLIYSCTVQFLVLFILHVLVIGKIA